MDAAMDLIQLNWLLRRAVSVLAVRASLRLLAAAGCCGLGQ
jgi:hypothetical protein